MRVIHEFVDTEGRTQFDEFDSPLPLDMGDIPETAHVLLSLRSNARRIAELWKECDDGTHRKKLYVGCPAPGLPEIGKWDKAQLTVRQLCFENPDAIHGGLRAARINDYINCRVVAMSHDIHQAISRDIEAIPEEDRTDKHKLKITRQKFVSSNQAEIVNTLSSHPLWKRLSWIHGLDQLVVFNLIGALADPTWFVHPDDPARAGLFKERCGIYNPVESLQGQSAYTDVFVGLSTPFLGFFNGDVSMPIKEINKPGFYFLRYAFLWMQHYLAIGEDEHNAFIGGLWRHTQKLANYIWLSWMETMHRSVPVNLDEDRFFSGDKTAAKASYKAAVS